MDTPAGRLFDGRYRIGRLLGRGGMATVREATDTRLARTVALKLFHQPADEVVLARLRVEAELLAGLSHPGLLKVFDVSTTAAQPYLVMQLATGCTLRSVIDRGALPPATAIRIASRLAETLAYVHSRQIMHRDLKPSNVLLDRTGGGCYLADFGIAMAAGAARLTATGHCVGTAAYLAPEQVAGADTGPAADIYALGLVLLECLTGQPEYTGTEVEAAIARLSRPPHIPDSIPPALAAALRAMTARDPAARADAAACVRLLDEALAGLRDEPGAERTVVLEPVPVAENHTRVMDTRPARRPRRTSRRLTHAAAATVVAAGAAVATLLLTGDPAPAGQDPATRSPAQVENAPVVAVVPQTAVANVVEEPAPGPAGPAPVAPEKPKDHGKHKGGGKG